MDTDGACRSGNVRCKTRGSLAWVFVVATVAFCLGLPLAVAARDPAASKQGWLTVPVSFRSVDGVQLSGSFVTPRKGRAIAAVVLGPGSLPGERYDNLAAVMALRGLAVLTYDKRGVGKSGGAPGRADDISAANLSLFAADAAAAMRWVSGNARLQSLPRGFVAISQSGWVIPLALAQSPPPDFLGFWSGPTCTTSEQLHYQALSAERDHDRARLSKNEIAEAMRHVTYRPDDVDPLKPLGAVSIPALWLFGGQDPHVPITLSVQRLSELIGKGRSNFEYRVFPREGHNLADSTEQESFVAMIEWIKRVARHDGGRT